MWPRRDEDVAEIEKAADMAEGPVAVTEVELLSRRGE